MNIQICGASKGHWGRVILATRIRWVSEISKRRVKPPKFLYCECEHHQGRREKIAIKDMYIQIWGLTDEEIEEAIKNFYIFSLESKYRYICRDCYEKLNK